MEKIERNEIIKLIDGQFSPEDAREILMSLFTKKLQFHEMNNLSSKERFGKEDPMASIRIPELKESLEKINEIIKNAEREKEILEIKSTVNIHFVNRPNENI